MTASAAPRPSMRTSLRHLRVFLAFVIRNFPLARVALLLTFVLLILEYAGFSLMVPLASENPTSANAGVVVRFWQSVVGAVGLDAQQMTWLWLFVLLLMLRTILGYVHLLLTNWLAKQVHRHLSEATFRRVLVDEPMTQIYSRSIGYYITLAGDDTFRAGTIINTASLALAAITTALSGFALLYAFSAAAFWATVAFLSITAGVVGLAFRALVRINARSVALAREASTAFIEALNGLRSIRSMDSERFFLSSYADQISRYVRLLFGMDAIRSGIKFVPATVALLVGVVALWPGAAHGNGLTATYFFAITVLLIRLFVALGTTVNQLSILLTDLRAATDIDELVNGSRVVLPQSSPADATALREVELRGIEYGYKPTHKVIDRLDFRFRPGQTIAIVGPSGSGKSTLADILLGLIRPDAGAVLVNGGQQDVAALRRHVILVEQQARIFSTSVRENLLLGTRHDDEALWNALHLVDLEHYVRGLPGGLDAVLQYQGANLSGGQRQRLGIARALIRDPKVLILDEATSALDARTSATVVGNLRQIMRSGILIFITHEKSLADGADVVLTLGHPEPATEPDPRPEVGLA
jgi:ABC-type bacteriocin/lantibiotic exporter with double-glycine peptidase domain